MSIIFTPDSAQIKPLYVDGVENVLTRSVGIASTQQTSLASLKVIRLEANLFNGLGKLLRLSFVGFFGGAGGTKRLLITLAGLPVFDSGLLALNNHVIDGNVYIVHKLVGGDAAWQSSGLVSFSTGGVVAVTRMPDSVFLFNPQTENVLEFFGQVSNAIDFVQLEFVIGSLL